MLRRPTTARHPASESRSAGCARPKVHHLYQRSPLSAVSMGCEARSHVLRLGENDGFEEWQGCSRASTVAEEVACGLRQHAERHQLGSLKQHGRQHRAVRCHGCTRLRLLFGLRGQVMRQNPARSRLSAPAAPALESAVGYTWRSKMISESSLASWNALGQHAMALVVLAAGSKKPILAFSRTRAPPVGKYVKHKTVKQQHDESEHYMRRSQAVIGKGPRTSASAHSLEYMPELAAGGFPFGKSIQKLTLTL